MTIHKGFNSVGVTVLLLCVAVGIGVVKLTNIPLAGVFFSLVGLYFLFAIVVVDQWEKVAVLRFGRYRGLRGPGLFLIIPIAETLSRYVDQRVRVTTVSAESTLTRDTVPVNVDAIIFWLVWNAEKSILEVENFLEAITLGSQTALLIGVGANPGALNMDEEIRRFDWKVEAGAEYIVSADTSCLMHQKGCAERIGVPIKFIHIAQILNGAAT